MSLAEAESLLASGPKTYDLEPDTKRLLEEQRKRLTKPSTQDLLGVLGKPGQGLVTPTQSYDYSAGLGGESATMGQSIADAVAKRNEAKSRDYINSLSKELELTAPARDAKNMRLAGQNLARESEVALNNNRIRKQYDLDRRRLELYKQQQKDGILASVLGVVGAIAGTALGVVTGGAGFGLTAAALGGMAGKTVAEGFTKETAFNQGNGPSLMKS